MDSIVARTWKKKVIFGVSLLVCVVAVIFFGTYATYRANAERLSTGVSAPEETDMHIDVKVNNGLIEPQKTMSTQESNNVAPSTNQQAETNETKSDVKVRVDGKTIDVPENGSIHKEITTENGSASIDVSTQSNSSSNNSRTRSSIKVDVDSSVRVRSETRE